MNLVGSRHFEVAKALKEIPKGSTFVIRLVEPQKAGFGKNYIVKTPTQPQPNLKLISTAVVFDTKTP